MSGSAGVRDRQAELDEVRAMIGRPLRVERWNHEASLDTIRHYAWGIGDDNPLYSDPAYAASSRWGTQIAPPTFLYSVSESVIAPGLPSLAWFYAGAEWVFDEPVRRHDEIRVESTVTGIKDVSGKRVAEMYLQSGQAEYFGQHGRRLGKVTAHCFRLPLKSDGAGGMPFAARPVHRSTPDELAAIERMVLNEYRRGAETRYWEDVSVGEELPVIARGPLAVIDMMSYYAGAIGTAGYKSTKLRWIYRDWALNKPEHLPNALPPAYFAADHNASMGHLDKSAADAAGMPGAYDNGLQRIGFIATGLTNWMGDDGELRKLDIRIKGPVVIGDTTFVKGTVTAKSREGDHGLVAFDMRAENQLGEVTASGTATVELPLR